jgi:hypothetical protein
LPCHAEEKLCAHAECMGNSAPSGSAAASRASRPTPCARVSGGGFKNTCGLPVSDASTVLLLPPSLHPQRPAQHELIALGNAVCVRTRGESVDPRVWSL